MPSNHVSEIEKHLQNTKNIPFLSDLEHLKTMIPSEAEHILSDST